MRSSRQGNYIVYYDDAGKEISRRLANLNLPGGAFSGYSSPGKYQNTQGAGANYGNRTGLDRGLNYKTPPTDPMRAEVVSGAGGAPNTGSTTGSATGSTAGTGNPTSGGSGTPGAGENVATDAIGGFSGMIKDAQLRAAWENPEALLNLYANKVAGMDPSGGGEAELQRLAPSLGILWMIMNDQAGKGQLDEGIAGSRDYVNWMEPNLGAMLGTAGGSILSDPGSILGTLLNPQGETLQTYLGAGGEGAANLTRTDQVDNMINAMRYGLEPTLPTPTLNALLNVLSVKGRQYVADQLTGATEGSFPELMSSTLRG